MKVLLDTHIWIWWLTGQAELSEGERQGLERQAAQTPPLLSAISLWEAQLLHSKGRLLLNLPFARWLVEASLPDVVQLVPITPEVILRLDNLPARFHGDPADRIIVASALASGACLCTSFVRAGSLEHASTKSDTFFLGLEMDRSPISVSSAFAARRSQRLRFV